MDPLFDMHCHLDFADDPAALAAGLAKQGVGALSCGVAPGAYESVARALAAFPNVRAGVGLHPWWVADGRCGEADVALAERLIARGDVRIVAEVGLDFAPRRAGAREAQLSAFARVAAACARSGGKVLSVHAVRAAGEALDVLARTGVLAADAGCACIFHWFSGTSDELARAVREGCFFSVNPRMLETKRGRAYARAIPEGRLLLETDEPPCESAPGDAAGMRRRLDGLLDALAEERRAPREQLAARIAQTSRTLLDMGEEDLRASS